MSRKNSIHSDVSSYMYTIGSVHDSGHIKNLEAKTLMY
jgi:hypothetical protein